MIGDLDLNGSVLLVKGGNLKVTGAVKGTGIILAERDVEIFDGGVTLDTSEQVAIGCKGNFTLHASSPLNNFFNGLVYAEGNIEAKDITVVGAVVGNGKRGAPGNVLLDNVRFIYNPGAVEIVVFPPLVTAREWEDKGKVELSITSATVRPSADGTKWVAQPYVGLQHTPSPWVNGKGPKDPNGDHFRGVDESEWDYDKIKQINPATFEEPTLPPIEVPRNSGSYFEDNSIKGVPAPPELVSRQQSLAYEAAMKEAVKWLDAHDSDSDTPYGQDHKPNTGDELSWYDRMSVGQGDNNWPDGTKHIRELVNEFRNAPTSNQPSGVLHFNLNNLLAEFDTNTPRVMLWRPIDRP